MLEYEELEKQRISIIKKANKLYIPIVLCIITSIFLCVFLGIIFFVFCNGVTIYLISNRMRILKTYNIKYKEEVVRKVVMSKFPDAIYDPLKGFPEDVVNNVGFFNKPDRYFSTDLIKANYEGVEFYISDIQLDRIIRSNNSTHYQTFVKGRFIVIDFVREFNEVVKIFEKKSLGLFNSFGYGLEKIEIESIKFNKKFTIYTSNPQMAFYVLTPQMQEELLDLETRFEGHIYYAFIDGKFYISINDKFDSLELDVYQKITQKHIDNILVQLNLVPFIIKQLKFDSSIKFAGVKTNKTL